jgi:hypothetical protein
LAHFCHAPSDVIFSAHSKGTPPVKVIRRNSHFFDCRQLRHIDIEAQSKRDQQKKNKKTNTLASPQPARLKRSTPGLFWMIKQVIPDFSTLTLFHVRQLGTKIFPKNLGHAHKVNEYMVKTTCR